MFSFLGQDLWTTLFQPEGQYTAGICVLQQIIAKLAATHYISKLLPFRPIGVSQPEKVALRDVRAHGRQDAAPTEDHIRHAGVRGRLYSLYATITIHNLHQPLVASVNQDRHRPRSRPPYSHTKPAPHRDPKPAPGGSHPIWHLITEVREEPGGYKDTAISGPSRRLSLNTAGGITCLPRPISMKWFEFPKTPKNVQLIDEFDTVYELITPFWVSSRRRSAAARPKPSATSQRHNRLMGIQVRDGNATNIVGASEWQQQATFSA